MVSKAFRGIKITHHFFLKKVFSINRGKDVLVNSLQVRIIRYYRIAYFKIQILNLNLCTPENRKK